MAWRDVFKKGVSAYRAGNLQDSLYYFSQAIELDGDQFVLYDSRASVHDRLGRPKDALRDSKRVIELAPDRWQGYVRSARVLLKARKHDAALAMISLALERVGSDDTKKRTELAALQEDTIRLRNLDVYHERNRVNHFSSLPVEIMGEIFMELIRQDSAQVIVIASTCRQWRHVALSTVMLWETLVLSDKHPANKAKTWSDRSKGRIKELCVRRGVTSSPGWSFNSLDNLSWDALRICKLEEHSFFPHPLPSNSFSRILSHLEELQISQPAEKNNWNPFLTNFIRPRLLSLTINNANFNWAVLIPHFVGLVTLIVRQPNTDRGDDVLAVIEANPKLKKLVLDFTQFLTPASKRQTPIQLCQIAHLEIGGALFISDIFRNVVFPSLERLCLSRCLSTDVAFTQLIPAALTELRMQSCGITASTLISFLRCAPSLQILQMTRISGAANAVAEALAMTASLKHLNDGDLFVQNSQTELPLCPSLSHLDFSYCDDIKTGPLVRLIRSRRYSTTQTPRSLVGGQAEGSTTPTVAQISSLILDGCPQIEVSTLPWLRSKLYTFSCIYMNKEPKQRS